MSSNHEPPILPHSVVLQVRGFEPSRAAVEAKLDPVGEIMVEDMGAGHFTIHCADPGDAQQFAALAHLGLFVV